MLNFNPTYFIQSLFSVYDATVLEIDGIKLNAKLSVINFEEIIDIGVWGLDKNYDYEMSNLNFTERLELLYSRYGWVHLAGGLSAEIDKGEIKSLILSKRYLGDLTRIGKEDIIKKLGNPDKELIDSFTWGLDYIHDADILVYKNKELHFHLNPDTGLIHEITIGPLDESRYSTMK